MNTQEQILQPPRYQHDCKKCCFLGAYLYPKYAQFRDNDDYDLYYCEYQLIGGSTVIARYTSQPGDYLSGMPRSQNFLEQQPDYVLNEAYRRAKAKGYAVHFLEGNKKD